MFCDFHHIYIQIGYNKLLYAYIIRQILKKSILDFYIQVNKKVILMGALYLPENYISYYNNIINNKI